MKYRGRPAKYENPEEMKMIIIKYFEECEDNGEIPCVTGLGYALGMSRNVLLEYENNLETGNLIQYPLDVRQSFSNTIKEAKQYIEYGYEQRMLTGKTNCIASIFTLKNNFKWVDKTEQVIENKSISIDLEDEE